MFHRFDSRHSCPHFPKDHVDIYDKPRQDESVVVAGRKPSAKLIPTFVLQATISHPSASC